MVLGKEPLWIIGIVTACLTAVQGLAIPMPDAVHAAISVVLVGLATAVGRSVVSPAPKA